MRPHPYDARFSSSKITRHYLPIVLLLFGVVVVVYTNQQYLGNILEARVGDGSGGSNWIQQLETATVFDDNSPNNKKSSVHKDDDPIAATAAAATLMIAPSELRTISWRTDVKTQGVRSLLIKEARQALKSGPYSVMDKKYTPPSHNKHDYLSAAPYNHPKDGNLTNLFNGRTSEIVHKDGQRLAGTVVGDAHSNDFDRSRWWYLASNTTVLALAWLATDDMTYTDHAAELFRVFFLNEETKMNPEHGVQFAQVNGKGPWGVLDTKDMYFVLDTVRFVCESGSLTPIECDAMRSWTKVFGTWLLDSSKGLAARGASNNHGVLYEVQLLSVLAFGFEQEKFANEFQAILARLNIRIRKTFDCAGGQPLEQNRALSLNYHIFNLIPWLHLAVITDRLSVHQHANDKSMNSTRLWDIPLYPNGPPVLLQALRYILQYMPTTRNEFASLSNIPTWPFKQIAPAKTQGFLYLLAAGRTEYGLDALQLSPELLRAIENPEHGVPRIDDVRVVDQLDWASGLRPLWSIGFVQLSRRRSKIENIVSASLQGDVGIATWAKSREVCSGLKANFDKVDDGDARSKKAQLKVLLPPLE